MPTNPSLERRWIQTNGLPIDKLTAAVRAHIDDANSTKVAEGAKRVVLFDQDDKPICSIDFGPERYSTIETALGKNAEPVTQIGDTTITKIDAASAHTLLAKPRDYFDPTRELPPLDLPDYDPFADKPTCSNSSRTALWVAAIAVALFLAYIAAAHLGLLN